MSLSTEARSLPHAKAGIAYNLAGLTLLVLLAAIGVAYLIDQAGRVGAEAQPHLEDLDPVAQTIAGRELAIPRTWFRYGEQIKEGFASQVDLDFRIDLLPDAQPTDVEVTLLPNSRARASSTLLDRVYLHQFAEGNVEAYPGLVGKPLQAQEGYAGETVWYDALAPAPFVAKCAKAVEPAKPDTCLRTINLPSGIAAVLKFDASALQNWQGFDDALGPWLDKIGAL